MIVGVTRGALAQLVEQRPEEPCVPSSSLGGATSKSTSAKVGVFLLAMIWTQRAASGSTGER